MTGELLGTTILAVAVWLGVLLISREIVCWYFKINDMVSLQAKIADRLEVLVESESAHGGDSGGQALLFHKKRLTK